MFLLQGRNMSKTLRHNLLPRLAHAQRLRQERIGAGEGRGFLASTGAQGICLERSVLRAREHFRRTPEVCRRRPAQPLRG